MYHILYVDDEPGLLEVGKLFLEHCGEVIVDTVTSAPEALTLLAIKNYDGIISDYQMPDMDGIEFLKIIRASGKTIPFILFTGRGREEVVIQALNEGADFYLQKGGEPQSQFTELTNKVRYAIMRRSAEESLKQNEAQLRQIIDLVPHLIFVKDINGNYLLANRASAERYHTDVATLVGKSQSLFHGNSVELQRMLDDDRDVITTGTTKFIPEDPYTDTSGNLHFFQTTKVPFTTVGSNQQAVLGVAIDITKSKQVEKALRESKERYRRIVETTDEGIFQLGENLETVYVNRKMAEMHGCTPGEIIGKSITLFMAADDLPEHSRHMQERRQGKSGRYERRYITKAGQVRWMQVSATPLMDPDGTFRGSFAMCSDITERKTAEVEIARRNEELRAAYEQLRATENELKQNYNKLAKGQNLLEESEQRYRNVVEDQTEFISRFLPNGTHVFVNEAYCRYFGLKRDEIVGHRLRPKIPVDTRERLNLFFASLTRDHPIDTIEHPIIMPDGSTRWHRWSDRAIFDRSGTVIEYQSVGRDITKEKETQIALEKSEKRFRDLSDLLPVIVYEVDINGNLKYANHIAFELFGYTDDDFRRGLNIRQMIAPEDREQAGVDFRAMVERKEGQRGPAEEYLALRKDGSTFPISIYASPISVNGRITGFRGILVDITECRKAENALRESQRKLADAIDLANLVTWEHDFKTGNLTFDDRFSTLYGMNAEPNCINHMTAAAYLQKTVHPEDLPILLEEDEKTRTTPDPHYVSKREYRIIRGDGEIRRIEMCVGVTKDAEGRTIKTHGVNQDVTERENAKEALRESEEKFRSFVENSNDILYSTTPEGIFTYISPKLTELTGQNTSEILGKSFES
ncbi:MAG: PAS domain S-box protein, partial [Methanoregula sp.]